MKEVTLICDRCRTKAELTFPDDPIPEGWVHVETTDHRAFTREEDHLCPDCDKDWNAWMRFNSRT